MCMLKAGQQLASFKLKPSSSPFQKVRTNSKFKATKNH